MIAPADISGLVCGPDLAIAVLHEIVLAQRLEIARLQCALADAIALAKAAAVEAYYLPEVKQ